jgi:hypothetical protein
MNCLVQSEGVVRTVKQGQQESGTHGLSSAAQGSSGGSKIRPPSRGGTHELSRVERKSHQDSEVKPAREGHLPAVEGRVMELSGW